MSWIWAGEMKQGPNFWLDKGFFKRWVRQEAGCAESDSFGWSLHGWSLPVRPCPRYLDGSLSDRKIGERALCAS